MLFIIVNGSDLGDSYQRGRIHVDVSTDISNATIDSCWEIANSHGENDVWKSSLGSERLARRSKNLML